MCSPITRLHVLTQRNTFYITSFSSIAQAKL
uniref:Uncharacterized protein n=1 Tax=Arundo donax TaxID=35708 RepID=A0A0A9AKT1_ARUDO